jgi:endonuclease/exonuclease/phosphatase family metal-dependent hydrolase
MFPNNLQNIIQQFPEHCPIIIMGDFNVDILKDNNQVKKKTSTIIFHGQIPIKITIL